MAQAMLAPTLAMEAKTMKRFGTLRRRLNAQYVTNIKLTPTNDKEAPILSRVMTMSTCCRVRALEVALVAVADCSRLSMAVYANQSTSPVTVLQRDPEVNREWRRLLDRESLENEVSVQHVSTPSVEAPDEERAASILGFRAEMQAGGSKTRLG